MKSIYRSLFLILVGATQNELARQIRYLKVENQVLRSKLPYRVSILPGRNPSQNPTLFVTMRGFSVVIEPKAAPSHKPRAVARQASDYSSRHEWIQSHAATNRWERCDSQAETRVGPGVACNGESPRRQS